MRGWEKNDTKLGPCSVAGHIPPLPCVWSRVWIRVGASFREGVGKDVAHKQA